MRNNDLGSDASPRHSPYPLLPPSLPPRLRTGVREHPSLMPGLPLPSLPAKEFLEAAKSAPRWALFVPSVGMLALHHPLLGSRGGGCPRGRLVWLRGCPRGLVLLRGSTRDAQLAPRSTGCWGVRGGGQAGILLMSLALSGHA